MYGAWCFGDISRTADTLVLYKLSEVSMCALWMSEIGWLAPWKERRRCFGGMKGWIDGWCGAGTNVAVDWMGFWGKTFHLCFPRWQCEDGAGWKVPPVCLAPRLGGFSEGFEALGSTRERRWTCLLVSDPGTKTPPWSLYDRSFFWCFWCSY